MVPDAAPPLLVGLATGRAVSVASRAHYYTLSRSISQSRVHLLHVCSSRPAAEACVGLGEVPVTSGYRTGGICRFLLSPPPRPAAGGCSPVPCKQRIWHTGDHVIASCLSTKDGGDVRTVRLQPVLCRCSHVVSVPAAMEIQRPPACRAAEMYCRPCVGQRADERVELEDASLVAPASKHITPSVDPCVRDGAPR